MATTTRGIGYDAINWIYRSYNRAKPHMPDGPDAVIRHPEWTGRLLERLGRPDTSMYNVAVTGSKGKGSHAILTAAMLQRMGLRVGLFTGPHLVDFMERFRIDGEMMPEELFVEYVARLRPLVESFQLPPGQYFGPVGLLAVLAVQWFAAARTDVNVLELGRGARHDDVNQVHHVGAIVGPIFLEHQRELGATLAEVGFAKAGILTPDVRWAVTHPQSASVAEAFRVEAAGRLMTTLGADFRVVRAVPFGDGCRAEVETARGRTALLLPGIRGTGTPSYLVDNAAVSLVAAEQVMADLRPNERIPSEFDLRDLRLVGRLQVVHESPRVVVDGTIHGRSAELVRQFIHNWRAAGNQGRIGAVIGIPADKDGPGVVHTLARELDWLVVCSAHNPHLRFDERLAEAARSWLAEVTEAPFLEDALAAAMERLAADDLLLILGTQSLVGDAMQTFGVHTGSIWQRHGD
ncbi:MAG: bifunctional folylpolyglutamate synthase/dihydrofolate synthase [Alicyclobacillus mali]|uniref:bifunctional folylpolyglutamate synthase/dihydrofolate synthase n=1 Tax=Alicyclobacillus mali (ex Roth et al. 2021) TaxID=1123961 RepID=UPI0023F37D78|nr:bifunctional folylpolyglutamate synthase/dihydrofolate synthase [Alicyclobacillus mali (ex Roth et al. 2021)]MCL6487363.1 bifunctional folylpolyglutamate synthase/dihydrofolate synthase [Alicyclobacillus mali (ex Roth et al. 2021)]